jgi:molybdate transport system substrate-binding protein
MNANERKWKMSYSRLCAFMCGLFCFSCVLPHPRPPLTIVAASDLKFAMEELIREFFKERPTEIRVAYGSSGNFYSQLLNGAPADLYFSADVFYPRKLVEQRVAHSEFIYGVGRLVLWARDREIQGIEALRDAAVQKVAIANPKHAPYGRAAEEAMRRLGVYDAVAPKLVYGENIAQTLQFVESGAAQIGIVALSLAIPAGGRYWEIPQEAYTRLEQGGVILNWAQDRPAADAFRRFVLGPRGRAVLERYGFHLP